jgi:hypothetical protein
MGLFFTRTITADLAMLKRNDFRLHTLQISAAFEHSIPRFGAYLRRGA